MNQEPLPIISHSTENDPPPILKSWNNLYGLVIGNLIGLIVLFYILTKIYS